jgi:hypothetical protein
MAKRFNIKNLLTSRKVSFWGADYEITPELVEERFGDGRQIIAYQPLNTRPNYYVVRIGRGRETDNCSEKWPDRLDDIQAAVDEQCGNTDDEGLDETERGWPVHSDGSGCTWWTLREG